MQHLKVIVVSCILIISSKLFAQADSRHISSRHYVGLELGINGSSLMSSTNFFFSYVYPYADGPDVIIEGLPFSNLGWGIGYNVAATIDLAISNPMAMQGKIFYRNNNSSNTEQTIRSCSGSSSGTPGTATIEDQYKLKLTFWGAEFGLRYQLVTDGLYARAGIEFASLISDRISGYEKILSSDNGCEYVYIPSGKLSGSKEIVITEQPTNSAISTSVWGLNIGAGTFIQIGNSNWVITPELNLGIPMTELFSPFFVDKYKQGYAIGDPKNPTVIKANTPNLWSLTLSVGIKLPFGMKDYTEGKVSNIPTPGQEGR